MKTRKTVTRLGAILQAIRDLLDGDALSEAQLAHPLVREVADRLRSPVKETA